MAWNSLTNERKFVSNGENLDKRIWLIFPWTATCGPANPPFSPPPRPKEPTCNRECFQIGAYSPEEEKISTYGDSYELEKEYHKLNGTDVKVVIKNGVEYLRMVNPLWSFKDGIAKTPFTSIEEFRANQRQWFFKVHRHFPRQF